MFQYFTEDTVFTLIYLVDEQLQDQHNTIKTQTQKYFLLKHIVLCCQCPIIELIWRVLLVEDNLVLRAAILLLSDLTLLESLSFGCQTEKVINEDCPVRRVLC